MIPFDFPDPNVVLWPNQTPAIYSNPLPSTTLSDTHPPPQGLPSSAAVLYQLGLTEMLSPNILLCPALNPYDWMVAYSALTLPHFCTDHLSVLQNPQVLDAFDAKIRQPLLSGQLDAVAAILSLFSHLPPPPLQSNLGFCTPKPASPQPPLCHPTMTILFRIPLLMLLNHLSILTIFMQLSPIWPLSLLMLMISPNPPKDGLRLLFSPLMPVRVSQATSTPTPKKLLAMVFSP